jgi:vancomycin permeability regulator SanA
MILRVCKIIFWIFISCCSITLINYKVISLYSDSFIITEVHKVPDYSTILIPGSGDSVNNYVFKGRINTTAELYHSKKINKIILSGRNDLPYYDEPANMEQALLERNVPSNIIVKNYGARRTIESIVTDNFQSDSVIIVSEKSHLERILLISKVKGFKALGLATKTNNQEKYRCDYFMRELLARIICSYECIGIMLSGNKHKYNNVSKSHY